MGMNNTSFVERYMGVIPNRTEPYYDWGNGLWLKTPTLTKVAGDGFLFTTLKDQILYEQKLHQLTDETVVLQQSQDAIPNSEVKTYGFGLELSDWGNRRAVHHAGATLGYHAQVVRFKNEKLTVVVLSNNGNLRSDIIADSIASVLLTKTEPKRKITYATAYKKASKPTNVNDIYGTYKN